MTNKDKQNNKSNTDAACCDRRAEKKDLILNEKKRSRAPYYVGVLIAILLAGGLFYWQKNGAPSVTGPRAAVAAENNNTGQDVVYPVAMFDDGSARHFEYTTPSGATIRYFILKSTDGIVRSAFDACDVCWPENKGYFQQGDNMVCRNCGRQFASVQVNEIQGGCNPAPLRRIVKDGQLTIRAEDILAGEKYFTFEAGRG